MGEARSQPLETENKVDYNISFNSPDNMQDQMQNEIKSSETIAHKANNQDSVSQKNIQVGKIIYPMKNLLNIDNLVTGLKSAYEKATLVSLSVWSNFKVNENGNFPFDKNSNLFKFYVCVFPYLKLLSLFVIFIVIFFSVNGILKCIIKTKSKFDF